MPTRKTAERTVHWLLTGTAILNLISGLGITQFRIIAPLTLGLLTKSNAFRIHSSLTAPFTILLILHIYLTVTRTRSR